MARIERGESDPVSNEGRGVARRRERLGMTKTELAEVAGVSTKTLLALETGQGFRRDTLTKVERALEDAEAEAGINAPPIPSGEGGLVEYEVSGDFGVRVVVRGPIANAEELERSVARLVRDIRQEPEQTEQQ